MDFGKEVEDHKGIHTTLDRFTALLIAMQADPSKFDAQVLLQTLHDLRAPLVRPTHYSSASSLDLAPLTAPPYIAQYAHLDEEVAHLAPAHVRVFSDEEITTTLKRMQKEIISSMDPWTELPFAIGHTPPTVRDFPPLPWLMRHVLVPWVFYWRYFGYVLQRPDVPKWNAHGCAVSFGVAQVLEVLAVQGPRRSSLKDAV